MERLFAILLLSLFMNAHAMVAQSVIVNSDGGLSTVMGNTIFSSNGTVSTVMGNTIFSSNGTVSTVMGNTIYNSNGTISTIIGNSILDNSNGTHTILNNSALKQLFDDDDDADQTSLFPKNSRTYSNRHDIVAEKDFPQYNKNEIICGTLTFDIPVSMAFDRTTDYLQGTDYFLLSSDKQAGFIEAKIHIDKKKRFSATVGERRTLDFIIRPTETDQSIITLTIYSEEQYSEGDNLNRTYYYADKGICNDRSVYKKILKELQQYFLKNK